MSKSPIMFISLLTQTRSSFLVHLLSSSVTVVRPGKQRHVCKGLVRVSKILCYNLHHDNTRLQYLFEGGLKEAVAHFVTVAVTLGEIPEAVCGDETVHCLCRDSKDEWCNYVHVALLV